MFIVKLLIFILSLAFSLALTAVGLLIIREGFFQLNIMPITWFNWFMFLTIGAIPIKFGVDIFEDLFSDF